MDQILDKAIFDEVPRKARIEAHRAMAKVMAGVGRHIDAAHLVPDMVTDIVYRAVERSDATKLAQEILQVKTSLTSAFEPTDEPVIAMPFAQGYSRAPPHCFHFDSQLLSDTEAVHPPVICRMCSRA